VNKSLKINSCIQNIIQNISSDELLMSLKRSEQSSLLNMRFKYFWFRILEYNLVVKLFSLKRNYAALLIKGKMSD